MTSEEEKSGTKKNVGDEFEEATKGNENAASKEAVEEEEATGGGGVKDNVEDELDKASGSSKKNR